MSNPKEKTLLIVSILILSIFSIIIIQQPLFNYLGYEFSVSCALLVACLFGYQTIKIVQWRFPSGMQVNVADLRLSIINVIIRSLILLGIPMLIATINIFFIKNCSYLEGVLYYILIPTVTAIWSIMLAVFCVVIFKRPWLSYCLCVLVVLIHPLYLGYATPQIFSYNFVYGFFPGFTYDDVLSITPTLILFRALTMFVAFFLYYTADVIVGRIQSMQGTIRNIFSIVIPFRLNKSSATFLLSLMLFVIVWLFRFELGFESSSETIQRALGKSATTENFTIYYSAQSFTDEEIRLVAAMHEFRLSQVEKALQVNFAGKIDSYIYLNADMKRYFIGAGMTNIAKPWRREIHLNEDSWQGTLKHELTHVVAGDFGLPIIKAHYNIGLTEGLATAVDEDFGNRTLHEYAAAMIKFTIVKDLEHFINPLGFATSTSSVSYVLMGSFCKFLMDTYGTTGFKALYSGTSPENIYGKPTPALIREWKEFLERIVIPFDWKKHVEFYFKRPSIFAKECARAIANLNMEAQHHLANGHSVSAMQMYQSALQRSWNTESYSGLVRAAYQSARYDTVIDVMDPVLIDSTRRVGVLNLLLMYGNAQWHFDDVVKAKNTFEEILSLDLSDRLNEAASLRLVAVYDSNLYSSLSSLFIGSLDDSSAQLLLNQVQKFYPHPIVSYLWAKLLFRQKNYAMAIEKIMSSKYPFEQGVLEASKEQLIAESYFYLKNYHKAYYHFQQLLNQRTNLASRIRAEDWMEACTWFAQNGDRYLQ